MSLRTGRCALRRLPRPHDARPLRPADWSRIPISARGLDDVIPEPAVNPDDGLIPTPGNDLSRDGSSPMYQTPGERPELPDGEEDAESPSRRGEAEAGAAAIHTGMSASEYIEAIRAADGEASAAASRGHVPVCLACICS